MMSDRSAVLWSGGLDSTVLLAEELSAGRAVQPIHVRCGLAWESAEARTMTRLLALPPLASRSEPVITVEVEARHIYPADHWAVVGRPPAFDSPDEDVYLEGRNRLLISNAAVVCRQLGITRLLLAPLAGNPFADATPEFFAEMANAMLHTLDHSLEICAPYLALRKSDVARRGVELGVPLDFTLSCMSPTPDDGHCGACSKCRERQDPGPASAKATAGKPWTLDF
jgi:7-cyano-7-deazaguanine synthase